jgi:NDP-sugar pyrophosphorylase family protein
MIINYLKDNDNFGCNIQVSDERDMLLETGGGLRKAEEKFRSLGVQEFRSSNEGILICNVDILSNIDIPTLLQAYNPNEMGVVVVSERETQRYLLFNDENRLCGWTNIATGELRGPIADTPHLLADKRPLAFSGMHVLNSSIFACLDELAAQKGDKFSLIDLYLSIANKEILRAYIPTDYRMMDVGKINQIEEAEAFARRLEVRG